MSSYKGFGKKQYKKAVNSHERTANDHLRKSERYDKGHDKDFALKTASNAIRHSNDIHRRTGNDKAMRKAFDGLFSNPFKSGGKKKKKGLW